VPDLSIEVDDVDAALDRMKKAGIHIEYGPVDEPWGVRRFYVRDPFGKLVNILAHAS
jgi:catechol 2,3-dioxygenase-like lactoylglutathione lyase family enzyme